MSDNNKFQSFLNELLTVENQLLLLQDQYKRSESSRLDLERQIISLKKESDMYRIQADNLAKELEMVKAGKRTENGGVSDREKLALKQKLQETIKKIDTMLDNSSK